MGLLMRLIWRVESLYCLGNPKAYFLCDYGLSWTFVLFGRAFFRQKLRVGWGLPPTAIVFRFLFGSPIPSALEPHLPKGGRESRASMIGL